ncbi:MAG TPA: PilN domain-containing protein [Tissierellales bacterium]|nr:PilN domain-containing protein [Tissierellales bacterium]
MKDLNFFEPYIEKKEFKIEKEKLTYLSILVFVLFIVILGVKNQIKIKSLNNEVSQLRNQVENEKNKGKVEELLSEQEKVDKIKENMTKIKLADEKIEEYDLINEELLQVISSKMPEDILLTSINGDINSIELYGVSKDKYSIAKFQYSLQDTEIFLNTFISNILLENSKYNFSIHLKLRDEESGIDDEIN